MKTLGSILREARSARGETLDDLAGEIGASKARLAMYEADLRRPDPEVTRQLAAYLGVDAQRLLAFRQLMQLPSDLRVEDVAAAAREVLEEGRRRKGGGR